MDESKHWQMMDLMKRGAQALQTALINKTHINLIEVSKADRWESAGPALRPPGHIGDFEVASLPRWMYGNPCITRAEIEAAWSAVAACLDQTPGSALVDVVAIVQPLFPDLPFRGIGESGPSGVLARFVLACGWHHGSVKVAGTSAEMKLGGKLYGVTNRFLMWDGNYRRMRGLTGEPLTAAVTAPVGRSKLALRRTAAVVRHLQRELPELRNQVATLCGAAVYLGRDYEEEVIKLFDTVDLHPDDEMSVDDLALWKQAFEIISTATSNPLEQLYELLYPVMGFPAFNKTFGNPHIKRTGVYRDDTRQRHHDLLAKIKSGETNLSILKLGGGAKASAAQSLYELQRSIGKR